MTDAFLAANGGLDDRITQRKLNRKGFFEEFSQPLLLVKSNGLGASTGTAADVNQIMSPENVFELAILGTQTILFPGMTTGGLDIGSMDQTANDGLELTPGIIAASRRRGCFKVGTDPAFYCRAKLSIVDVSGTDDLAVGFRKAEAYQANVDDYDEAAFLNAISGTIKLETILNNAATTTTSTAVAWADAETHTLEIRVSAAGVVTCWVDGVQYLSSTVFTFDSGEFLVPFIYFLQDTDIAGIVNLIEWECGYCYTADGR